MTDSTGQDRTAHNQATYDRIAPLYTRRQLEHQAAGGTFWADLQAAFVRRLGHGGRVADLGCGPALDGRRLAEAGLRAVGVDRSSGMLAEAATVLPGRVTQGDLRRLPLADARLDGVWCAASLLHVPEPHTSLVLNEFSRVLRPAGTLALVTALGESTSAWEPVPYAPAESRWFVYRSRAVLLAELDRAGFVSLDVAELEASRHWIAILAKRL
ncbi:MAG TPA: class I SAM-dependent methyltransferase [Acidimicrobiales bacterium]|nr:class I SAM-dependent methyltransferase [Acidimicrobiales bacterium]